MGQAIRVLVIDDEVRFADNLSRLLNARGYCAETAYTGVDALKAVKRKQYDAAVLDMKMPGMDGIETLRELKRLENEIEVIMLTGHADVETGIQAIREGAFDYLFKPCDVEILSERLREAVAAESIKRNPVLWPRSVVKEISTADFIRLDIRDDLKKALAIFNEIRQAGMREELHVIDRQDRLRGVISKKDLLGAAGKANPEQHIEWRQLVENPDLLPATPVADIMRPPPSPEICSRAEEKLTELADRMIRYNFRCLPVMDGERFVGIVRFRDILQFVSAVHDDSGDQNGNPGC